MDLSDRGAMSKCGPGSGSRGLSPLALGCRAQRLEGGLRTSPPGLRFEVNLPVYTYIYIYRKYIEKTAGNHEILIHLDEM